MPGKPASDTDLGLEQPVDVDLGVQLDVEEVGEIRVGEIREREAAVGCGLVMSMLKLPPNSDASPTPARRLPQSERAVARSSCAVVRGDVDEGELRRRSDDGSVKFRPTANSGCWARPSCRRRIRRTRLIPNARWRCQPSCTVGPSPAFAACERQTRGCRCRAARSCVMHGLARSRCSRGCRRLKSPWLTSARMMTESKSL